MNRLLVAVLVSVAACAAPAEPPSAPAPAAPGVTEGGPFSVILFIADGASIGYWDAARLASSPLGIESFPVVGLVDTESVDSRITDSAAGATAYATGVRTLNGAIGLAPDSSPAMSVLQVAQDARWATGLVATSTITHATPAAFAAHVPSRNMHQEIARQMADRHIDVLLGGGRRHFQGAGRTDGVDLIARLADRAVYVEDADAFRSLDMDTVSALVGLFSDNNPGPATDREPGLSELTAAALAVLEKDPDGFFLMVEGSQIDWRGHDNATIQEIVAEVLDLDLAVRRAVLFQERRPNTLIIVTADHGTGGLSIHPDGSGSIKANYTTSGHTAGMVPLFARGPGAHLFGGIKDNDHVGRLLLQLVREGGVVETPAR